jgi:hypothetical protein
MKMTKTILLTLLTTNSFALDLINFNPNDFSRVIKDETHTSTIRLNKENVRCSALGYGASELKISIPSLKWNAIFDHSNNDGRGPCVTAGTSFCGFNNFPPESGIPDILLDEERPTEEISVNVKLHEEFSVKEESCTRTLREFVTTNVRGIDFTHNRIKSIGEISLKECNQIF